MSKKRDHNVPMIHTPSLTGQKKTTTSLQRSLSLSLNCKMRTRSRQAVVVLLWMLSLLLPSSSLAQILSRGFSATPDPAIRDFQPLLSGEDFAFGFRRVRETLLVLAIVHVSDNLTHTPVWTANPSRLAKWAPTTELSFNGTLALTDSGVELWSAPTGLAKGDMVVFQREANLQMVKGELENGHIWQSYDHPTDTIVEGQNLTAGTFLVSSTSPDDSSPGAYSMRLDLAGFGLYANFISNGSRLQQYWRRQAMQEKAVVSPNGGPIYAQVSPNGFLGMYQDGSAPLDVLSFDSFQRRTGVRIVRIEPDGNLRAYYWNVTRWVEDFAAIKDVCELPSACGPMAVCRAGGTCRCLENNLSTENDVTAKGQGSTGIRCEPAAQDIASVKEGSCKEGLKEVRAKGVDVPYKEFMAFESMTSLESCESSCSRNCSCWVAIYNNASRACYRLDYPLQTLLQVADDGKTAYVKMVGVVIVGNRESKMKASRMAELVVVVVSCGMLACVLVGLGHLWWQSRKRRLDDGLLREGLAPGTPYRDFEENSSSGSGGSVELSKR